MLFSSKKALLAALIPFLFSGPKVLAFDWPCEISMEALGAFDVPTLHTLNKESEAPFFSAFKRAHKDLDKITAGDDHWAPADLENSQGAIIMGVSGNPFNGEVDKFIGRVLNVRTNALPQAGYKIDALVLEKPDGSIDYKMILPLQVIDVFKPSLKDVSLRGPTHPLKNSLIDAATGKSKYGKIEYWSLGQIISVMSKRSFGNPSRAGTYLDLIAFVLDGKFPVKEVMENLDLEYDLEDVARMNRRSNEARKSILKQYGNDPEFRRLMKPPKFRSELKVWKWVAAQEAKFGKYLPIVQMRKKP